VPDYSQLESLFVQNLGLKRRPVGVAYLDAPPRGVARFSGVEPAGCSFWKLAAEGQTFYTTPADHHNCPIGSYTHSVPVPPEREQELGQTLELLAGIGYVRMEEIPSIFRLPEPPAAIVYAPLGECPVPPDVVLFPGRPGILMLLTEAAGRAGVLSALPLLGRPTCMALPAAISAGAVSSNGCTGNRVYTGLGEDELYFVIPGRDLERVAAEVERTVDANRTLTEYHRQRQASARRSSAAPPR
jgi:uncharacterized protein (DUF169 family)